MNIYHEIFNKWQIRKSLSSFLSLKEYEELKTWLYSDQAKLSEN